MEVPEPEPQDQVRRTLRVLNTRRAVRSFNDESVRDDLLDPLLDSMLAAPSASNKQAWAFVVVRRPRTLRLIHAFAPGIIERPPLIVVACFDHGRSVGGGAWDEGMLCVAMAVQNLLLAAHALELGGCPTASFRKSPVRRFLRLPQHLEPLLLVSIGHPAPNPRTTAPRRDRNEVISHEHWG